MSATYNVGKIYMADRKKYPDAIHPIVFIGPYKERPGFYIGAMLTHSPGWGNIKMNKEHFSDDFDYNNTHIVNVGLLKPEEWVLHIDKGNLTSDGIDFVKKNVSFDDLKEWNELVPGKA